MATQNDEFAPTNADTLEVAALEGDRLDAVEAAIPAETAVMVEDAPLADAPLIPAPAEPTYNPQEDMIRAEQERLAAERAARKEARQAALAPLVDASAAQAPVEPTPVPVKPAKRTTDKFSASFGLFLLRWAVAAVIGVRGVQTLLDPNATAEVYANTVLPRPELVAIGIGAALVVSAVLLFFGAMTRFAGLLLAAVAGVSLAFVQWGPWSPFTPGKPGFLGDFDLTLAAVGLMFLFVGAGGWSVDYGFRRRRQADRLAREQGF